MNTSGKSLRETVDAEVRELTKGYRTGKLAAARTLTGVAGDAGMRDACAGRAKALRSQINKLMKG